MMKVKELIEVREQYPNKGICDYVCTRDIKSVYCIDCSARIDGSIDDSKLINVEIIKPDGEKEEINSIDKSSGRLIVPSGSFIRFYNEPTSRSSIVFWGCLGLIGGLVAIYFCYSNK